MKTIILQVLAETGKKRNTRSPKKSRNEELEPVCWGDANLATRIY